MRTSVKNKNGEVCGWFDKSKATKFKENSNWDGRNWISKSTDNQFDHQNIFVTTGGKYILHSWSQWQGVIDQYVMLSKEEVSEWFSKNEYDDSEIPKELNENVNELEIK